MLSPRDSTAKQAGLLSYFLFGKTDAVFSFSGWVAALQPDDGFIDHPVRTSIGNGYVVEMRLPSGVHPVRLGHG